VRAALECPDASLWWKGIIIGGRVMTGEPETGDCFELEALRVPDPEGALSKSVGNPVEGRSSGSFHEPRTTGGPSSSEKSTPGFIYNGRKST
jgi:hypothetical protein